MKNWGFRENHHCTTQNPEKNTVSIYFQKLGDGLTHEGLSYRIKIFNHLKLCLATATHKFKWLKNY